MSHIQSREQLFYRTDYYLLTNKIYTHETILSILYETKGKQRDWAWRVGNHNLEMKTVCAPLPTQLNELITVKTAVVKTVMNSFSSLMTHIAEMSVFGIFWDPENFDECTLAKGKEISAFCLAPAHFYWIILSLLKIHKACHSFWCSCHVLLLVGQLLCTHCTWATASCNQKITYVKTSW